MAEMEARALRSFVADEALFDNARSWQEYRHSIFAALDRWLVKAELLRGVIPGSSSAPTQESVGLTLTRTSVASFCRKTRKPL